MTIYFNENDDITDSNILFKLSKIAYLKDLQQGKLFMNKLNYYKNCETEGMGDKEEGLIGKISSGILSIDEVEIGEVKNCSFYAYNNSPVFCLASVPMSKISDDKYEYLIDPKMFQDFITDPNEEYGLLIIEKDKFETAINSALENKNINGYWGKVTYTDTLDPIPPNKLHEVAYRKRRKFSHQNEWRLLLPIEIDNPYILEIGNLDSFSKLVQLKKTPSEIKFHLIINQK